MMNQKQKLIAVAIAGTFAMPLAAQAQSTVEIYGRLYPELVSAGLSGATAKGNAVATLSAAAATTANNRTFTMDSPNSRMGFRGSESLGGNMKAFYQLEMGFGVDNGVVSTTPGQFFTRDTFLGLSGGFGTIRLGNMDTVYKNLGDTLSFLGVSSGNFISLSNILSKQGFGSSSASSFHLRRPNSIYYKSPEFGGFSALLDYSLGETDVSIANLRVISTGLKYEAGPLYLAVAYEQHDNLFGGSKNVPTALKNDSLPGATSKDTGVRWTAQYAFPGELRVEGNFVTTKFDEKGGTAGKFLSYKHNVWSIAVEKKMQAVTWIGAFGQAGAGSCALVGGIACNTMGLDGKMFTVGAGYDFSKRTMAFAVFSAMTNGTSAVYSNLNNGKPTSGQDISTFALGLKHNF